MLGKLWGQNTKPRLLEQVRITCRQKHFSPKTEKSYVFWILQYILFHGKRHPKDMGQQEIEAYLNHLATQRHVSASTQFCQSFVGGGHRHSHHANVAGPQEYRNDDDLHAYLT
jgi:hypothetical protein